MNKILVKQQMQTDFCCCDDHHNFYVLCVVCIQKGALFLQFLNRLVVLKVAAILVVAGNDLRCLDKSNAMTVTSVILYPDIPFLQACGALIIALVYSKPKVSIIIQ